MAFVMKHVVNAFGRSLQCQLVTVSKFSTKGVFTKEKLLIYLKREQKKRKREADEGTTDYMCYHVDND